MCFIPREGFPDSSVGKEYACNAGDASSIPRSGRAPGEGIGYPLQYSWASLVVQPVKNPPVMWETWVQSLGWEDPLEKGKAIHSSILAWRIPWGCKESDTTERLSLHYSKSNVKPLEDFKQEREARANVCFEREQNMTWTHVVTWRRWIKKSKRGHRRLSRLGDHRGTPGKRQGCHQWEWMEISIMGKYRQLTNALDVSPTAITWRC